MTTTPVDDEVPLEPSLLFPYVLNTLNASAVDKELEHEVRLTGNGNGGTAGYNSRTHGSSSVSKQQHREPTSSQLAVERRPLPLRGLTGEAEEELLLRVFP